MTTPRAIAFFPWWPTDALQTFGPVRLLPYIRGKAPGQLPHVRQDEIDAVIHAYALRPGDRLRKATLLEVDDWLLGQDPTVALPRLFAAQEALGFAGLAARSLFGGHFGYCNFHDYSLVVQRYQSGRGDTFAYTMRRRDGGAQHLWSSDEFAFQRPLHVDASLKAPTIDGDPVQALLAPTCPNHWTEAVSEFNRANTDSADMPEHVELVMMKSAFERLLDIKPEWQDFVRALEAVLGNVPPSSPPTGPLGERWLQTYPRAPRLLHAWAREFCERRGAAAHGKKGGARHVWSEPAHLAFASVLFPLLLKKLAADAGGYPIREEDLRRLAQLDAYVAHDPFERRADASGHPWSEIDLEAWLQAAVERGREDALAALEEGLAAGRTLEQATPAQKQAAKRRTRTRA